MLKWIQDPKVILRKAFQSDTGTLIAHNYTETLLLKAYVAVYKFDIICLLGTYLDSKTLTDYNNLDISGYNLVRSDHPSNSKRGGACIYYKEIYVPLRVINVNYLNECIRFELNIGEKLCSFISLYRSPIQTQDEFDTFTDNLILNLDLAVQSNPYLVVVLGDFNGKLKTWYGCYKTNFEGNVLETPFSRFGLH